MPRLKGKELGYRMPSYAYALLQTLHFSERNPKYLAQLNDVEWRSLLALCDRTQMTLLLGDLGGQSLPSWVKARIHRNQLDNNVRFSRLQTSVAEINEALSARSIEFAVLKGYTNAPHFIHDMKLRSQGDVDLWCQPDTVWQARDVLIDLGYRAVGKSKGRHLDPMIREASWEWTGDYFAPDLPIPVDLHYQLWDASMEHIAGPRESAMWQRCSPATRSDGSSVLQLDLADALAFASLHVLMHLLHGDVRLQRVWELAFFLQTHQDDEPFWGHWRSLYSEDTRRMQVIPFALAVEWFGCKAAGSIGAEIENLPQDVLLWMKHYSFSPLASLFSMSPFFRNKDELLLNLCLLRSFKSKVNIVTRRLLPIHAITDEYKGMHMGQNSHATASRQLRVKWQRIRHHLAGLPFICWQLALWWWRR